MTKITQQSMAISLILCLPFIFAPEALSQQAAVLKGDEVSPEKLKVGLYAKVLYSSPKGHDITTEGYIKAVGKDSFTVGQGLWKEHIAYQTIIQLMLGLRPKDIILFKKHSTIVIPEGTRVRISTPDTLIGNLVSMNADSLILLSEDDLPLIIPRSSVLKLEISQGFQSKAKKSMTIGSFIGGMAGLTLGINAAIDKTTEWPFSPLLKKEGGKIILLSASAGCVVGSALGYLLGSHTKTEQWKEKLLPPMRLMINNVQQGAFNISASFDF